ncbi:MAG: protein translocase subunit SecF [Acidobacteria bacterium]|nr:protein translocase subunit SecF [Acidobacteriota bacterium]
MEFFRNPNIDWIGKKWIFIFLSFLLSFTGIVSLIMKGGPRYGIDFRGGTLIRVKFSEAPSLDRLRQALQEQGLGNSTLQQFGAEEDHEILVGLDMEMEQDTDLDAGRQAILQALRREYGGEDKPNWNEMGAASIAGQLGQDPSVTGAGLTPDQLQEVAEQMIAFRDYPPHNGMLASFDDLRQVEGVTPQIIQALAAHYSLPPYAVRNVEIVGPKVGAALRRQALSATLLGLASMLVYIALRFEWIYGVAAVLATFHDVIIAVGFLSIVNMEISLTVIAALLTLVGYSVNDTIVVFDRMRENVKLMRRESMTDIANRSINQTLSRTVLTSGLTFLTVLALFLFGGEVLRGFSFILVVGIVVGTYSSISVASTVVVSWQEYSARHRRGGAESIAANRGKTKRSKVGAGANA